MGRVPSKRTSKKGRSSNRDQSDGGVINVVDDDSDALEEGGLEGSEGEGGGDAGVGGNGDGDGDKDREENTEVVCCRFE